ncbi:alpha/beta fold hydrolase [Hymenobacter bucti]|uniref:Alpha/beta fold hydrolase n=1 Tax=Hymenobacter bucti TaxID=1844114 RepID=A0ABW4R1I1_9BACT
MNASAKSTHPPEITPASPPAGFTSATARVNGIQLHYVLGGNGEPVVLLHGWPQTWYEWQRLLEPLAAHYSVIVPDLRGFGASEKPATGYDTRTLAEDIHSLVQHLGLSRIRLVGHDIGLMVAYAYAAAYPTEVHKLVILDAPLPGVEPVWSLVKASRWHFGFNATPHLAEQLLAGRERYYLEYMYTTSAFNKTAFTAAEVDEFVRSYAAPGAMGASLQIYQAFDTSAAQNQRSALTKLPMPVLALGGDHSFGPKIVAMAELVATDVSGGSIPNCGHWVAEENPEYLLAQLLAFLP